MYKNLIDSVEVFAETLELKDLQKYLDMHNSITYISIGCSCQSEWTIEEDQQYPAFIRNYKKYHEDIKVNLILIDPEINKIPCLTRDIEQLGYVKFPGVSRGKPYDTCFKNVYSCSDNIKIYTFKCYVTYVPMLQPFIVGSVAQLTELKSESSCQFDITPLLHELNDICIRDAGVLIVHDFSGSDISMLDEYFCDYTDRYPDRILYDISDGTQSGCFIELKDDANSVYFEDKNEGVAINNIKKISPYIYDIILQDTKKYPSWMIKKIIRLKNRLISTFMKYMHNYRRALLWKYSVVQKSEIEIKKRVINIRELKIFDILHKTSLVKAYSEDDVDNFVEMAKLLYDAKKTDIEKIFHVVINLPVDCPSSWTGRIDIIFSEFIS